MSELSRCTTHLSTLQLNGGDTDMADVPHSAYDVLLAELDQVLSEWRSLVGPGLGARVTPARLMDSLPEIIPRLLTLARSGAVEIDDGLKQRISADHGVARREDVVPVPKLAEEWEALKQACVRILARNGFVGVAAEEATQRIDLLIDDAIGYTLRGYYQRELDTLRGRGLERRDAPGEDRRQGGDRRDSDAPPSHDAQA
jgi:hypothetical protein